MANRRWEGDASGVGVADGTRHLPEIRSLDAALRLPGWIAEEPDAHLLPHLARACERAGTPFVLRSTGWDEADGVYQVMLTWLGLGSLGELRRDLFALVGEIAESTTHVRQVVHQGALEYRVATGMLTGDSPFTGHGHLLTFRIDGARLPAIVAGMHPPGEVQ